MTREAEARTGDGHGREDDTPALTRAIAAGDRKAFGRFYAEWFDRSYRLVREFTLRDESFCLDVVQDAMLRVVKSIRPMDGAQDLRRWMVRVLHATAIDALRREARRIRREARVARRAAEADPSPDPAAAIELEARMTWLRGALEKLDREDRVLLDGRYEGGGTLEALGSSLGVSGDAASGRLRRLVARLRGMAREVFHECL